jgi:hypothetical protein
MRADAASLVLQYFETLCVIAPRIPGDVKAARSAVLIFPEYSVESRNILKPSTDSVCESIRGFISIDAKHFAVFFFTNQLHIYEYTNSYSVRLVAVHWNTDNTLIRHMFRVDGGDGMYVVRKTAQSLLDDGVGQDEDEHDVFELPKCCVHHLGMPISPTIHLKVLGARAMRSWLLLTCEKSEGSYRDLHDTHLLVPKHPTTGDYDFTKVVKLYLFAFSGTSSLVLNTCNETDELMILEVNEAELSKYDLSRVEIQTRCTPLRIGNLNCTRTMTLVHLQPPPVLSVIFPFCVRDLGATGDPNVLITFQRHNVAFCDVSRPRDLRVSVQCCVPAIDKYERSISSGVCLFTDLDAMMFAFAYEVENSNQPMLRVDVVRRPSDRHRVSCTSFFTKIPAGDWLEYCRFIPLSGQ